MYFDQLLGAARTQKLVELLFSAIFNLFLFISNLFQWFQQKTSEKEQKKAASTWKLIKIHNRQFQKPDSFKN